MRSAKVVELLAESERRSERRTVQMNDGVSGEGGAPELDLDELDEMDELCSAATPGPWFVRELDDDHAMGLVAVSTVEDTGRGERWPEFDHGELVAATLIQQPRYVDCADGRWEENAAFIAMAREAVPRLVREVKRLRGIIETTAGETG